MASCGSLETVFLDGSSPENPTFFGSLSPWKCSSSFTELFGELHFQEKKSQDTPSADILEEARNGSSNKNSRPDHGISSTDSTFLARTETEIFKKARNGSPVLESLEDVCNEEESRKSSTGKNHHHRIDQFNKRSRVCRSEFPPPISCIGRSGKPWVCFKSYREGGRFILREIRIPTQEFLHACREDGRLRLQFIQSDDDEVLGEDEDEDDEGHGDVRN